MNDLVRGVLKRDRRAIARAISLVEQGEGNLLASLRANAGHAHLVGVTGPPGVGKSTLINHLALAFRQRGKRVGILAVDPSSPLSGGALLGDRIRMRDLAQDSGVFIRSMSTRGAVGGLALATYAAADVLDAAGYEVVFIETVGAGQDEIAIARLAHTVVLVQAPGLGDEIQALKAGLIQVADVLVLNKADRAGAGRAARILEEMVEQREALSRNGWHIPVLRTVALDGTGAAEVVAALEAHCDYLEQSGERQRREHAAARAALEASLQQSLLARLSPAALSEEVERIAAREASPYIAAEHLLDKLCGKSAGSPAGSIVSGR